MTKPDSNSSFVIRHSSFPLRLIVDPPLPGVRNMAIDEALLRSAIERGVATLRFYQWQEPTLSLGYFQPYDDRRLHEPSRDLSCVRRHSGGGAIVHDRELTYSLAVPAGAIPHGDPESLYRTAHQSLIDQLTELLPKVTDLTLALSPGIRRAPADEPFLCFQRRSDGDLVVAQADGVVGSADDDHADDDHKVTGSAQRKRRGAVLQHGSVLLARSSGAPELPGLAELYGTRIAADALANAWAPRLAETLGATLESGSLEAEESRVAEAAAADRFDTDGWTRRR